MKTYAVTRCHLQRANVVARSKKDAQRQAQIEWSILDKEETFLINVEEVKAHPTRRTP